MSANDDELIQDALESLERVECLFFACEGPTLEPIEMATCHRCHMVARLRAHLGLPVIHDEETREYARALDIQQIASDCHRTISLDDALAQAREEKAGV